MDKRKFNKEHSLSKKDRSFDNEIVLQADKNLMAAGCNLSHDSWLAKLNYLAFTHKTFLLM